MEPNYDVVVAGAGLAGLAAAATAARAGARVLVLDARSPGGRARTDERRGFLFNQGAHALVRGGAAERVLAGLGVPAPTGKKPSTDVWGVAAGTTSPLPLSPSGAVRSKLVGAKGKAQLGRVLLHVRSIDPEPLADRSTARWIAELDLRPDAAAVVRTLARVAAYADDLDAVSADTVAAQLRTVLRAGVRYVDGGWQGLVDGLVASATGAGAELRPGSSVVAVHDDAAHTVELADGTSVSTSAVVLAVGGPIATAKVLREPPRWGLVGPPATAACLDLGLDRRPDRPVLFGLDEPLYLSTHTPSADLAPEGGSVVHLMRYGTRDADTDRAQLWAHARAAGIGEDDVVEQRFLARMVVTHAVPVPGCGLAGRPSVDAAGIDGVFVAGDWVGPEGYLADGALASGAAAGARAALVATEVPA